MDGTTSIVGPLSVALSLSVAACHREPPATTSLDTGATSGSSSGDESSVPDPESEPLPFDPAGPNAVPEPSQMGPYPIGVTTVELLDSSRPDETGMPRRLVTEIWYPAHEDSRDTPRYWYTGDDLFTEQARALLPNTPPVQVESAAARDVPPRADTRFPIVLFSHGSSGVRIQSIYLTEFLASHGYIVAAPDHVGNTLSDAVISGGPTTEALLGSIGLRPNDLGFVLAYLQGLSRSDPLGAVVDDARVGAIGHSLGALTVLRMLAEDRPLDVVVAQSPPGYNAVWFGALPVAPADITVPVMIHAGELDMTTPLSDAESIFTRLTMPRSQLTIRGAGHFSFSDMCRLGAEAIGVLVEIGLSEALDDGCLPNNIAPEIALPLQRHFAIGLLNGHLRDSPGSLELLTKDAADPLAPGAFEFTYEP